MIRYNEGYGGLVRWGELRSGVDFVESPFAVCGDFRWEINTYLISGCRLHLQVGDHVQVMDPYDEDLFSERGFHALVVDEPRRGDKVRQRPAHGILPRRK